MNRIIRPLQPFLARLRSTKAARTRPTPSSRLQPSQPQRPPPMFGAASGPFLLLDFFILTHLFMKYLYTVMPTYGISMVPTISADGAQILLSRLHRRGKDIQVGDMVEFVHPVKGLPHGMLKRVVGMEGDFVLSGTPGRGEEMVQVPKGHCWVAGDNQEHSRDSRIFGPLPLALIQAKVIANLSEREWCDNPLKEVEFD